MFAFVCLLLFSATNENERENRQLFYVLFSFLAKILSLNSKDTAATTDVVQLMIRIIIVLLLLLTRTIIPINFYAEFFIQQWKISAYVHWFVLKWGYPNFFQPTTLNNQLNQIVIMGWMYLKLTIKTPAWPRVS